MSNRSNATAGAAGCGHDYSIHDVVPLNLKEVKSVLEKANKDFAEMLKSLRTHGILTLGSAKPVTRSTKRQIEDDEEIPINEQVDLAIDTIMGTEELSERKGVSGPIHAHTEEYHRKWGFQIGVHHDLLRVYPELRFEIDAEKDAHIQIHELSYDIAELRDKLREEGQRLARLATMRNAKDNKPKSAKKAKK